MNKSERSIQQIHTSVKALEEDFDFEIMETDLDELQSIVENTDNLFQTRKIVLNYMV